MRSINKSHLRNIELKITRYLGRKVPKNIGTKFLTYGAFVCSVLIFVSYYFATGNKIFFILASLFIVGQWIFDMLDGHIGRLRDEGFVRWGYLMDHFFDYVFLSSICLGLLIIFPSENIQAFTLYMLMSCFMFANFLNQYALRDIKKNYDVSLAGLSPIEFRLFFISINLGFYFSENFKLFFASSLKYINFILLLALIGYIHVLQSNASNIDMKTKQSLKPRNDQE